MAETLLPALFPQVGEARARIFGRFFKRNKGTTTGAEEAPAPEAPVVTPAVITPEESAQFSEMEQKQKEEVAQLHLTAPQHVGGTANWQGVEAEVWYYPDVQKYGVIVTENPTLNSGPKFSSLEEANAYARGAVGMK